MRFGPALALLGCANEVALLPALDGGGALASGRPIGEPCAADEDCAAGRCVDLGAGLICTTSCGGGCPDGTLCVPFGEEMLCAPDVGPVCVLCSTDADCPLPGQRCLETDGGLAGCGSPCEAGACAEGFACRDAPDGEEWCHPDEICVCDEEREGATAPCTGEENEWGACAGVRTCAGGAWTECDAPVAQPEACNGLDDDCNGAIDDVGGGDPVEPDNDTCAGAEDLGSFPDDAPGTSVTLLRSLSDEDDEDWFFFDAPDSSDAAEGGDRTHVTIIAGNPDDAVRIDVIRVALGEDGCGGAKTATECDAYEWFTNFAAKGDPSGECPCGGANESDCSDNSARYYFRVYATGPLSCPAYVLLVENGTGECS